MKLHYYRTEKGGNLKTEIVLTRTEQKIWHKSCLQKVHDNPRWYLDNLEYLPEFHVDCEQYHRKHYKRDWARAKKECKKDIK